LDTPSNLRVFAGCADIRKLRNVMYDGHE